jgi:predicted O-methyltransferase YrrM
MTSLLTDLTLPPRNLLPELGYWEDEYLLVLYALLRQEKPQKVVELGTYRGSSTNVIGEVLRANNAELLIDPEKAEDPWWIPAQLITIDEQSLREYARPDHLKSYIRTVQGNTHDAKLAKQLCPYQVASGGVLPRWIDVLFIDADHAYESVRADYETWLPYVKVGGLILFHDIRPLYPHIEGSARHWAELQARYPGQTAMREGCQLGAYRFQG